MWSVFRNSRPSYRPYFRDAKPGEFSGYFHCATKKRLQRGWNLYQKHSRRRHRGHGRRRVRRRRPLPAGRLRRPVGDLLYLPSGSSSEERQAAKFRFMDLFLPTHGRPSRQRPPRDRMRRLEHRPPGTSTSRTGNPTRRTPASCRKNATGSPASSTNRAGSTPYRRLHPDATDALHLVVEPRPGLGQERRLALDYQIATPNSAPAPSAARSKTSASATTRPSRWITTIPALNTDATQMGFNDSRAGADLKELRRWLSIPAAGPTAFPARHRNCLRKRLGLAWPQDMRGAPARPMVSAYSDYPVITLENTMNDSQVTKDKLVSDFKAVVADTEELLKLTRRPGRRQRSPTCACASPTS